MWDYGTQSPKYFSMAIGITLTPGFFTLLIAQGVTRRMFSIASGIYLLGTAAATALLWVLARLSPAERAAFAIDATRLPAEGENWRVYADPAGKPFCLTWNVA